MTEIVIAASAEREVEEIAALILGDQPAAARRFLRAFAEICEKLQGAPLMGVARENDLKIPGLRSVRMPGFANYLVFYMIQEGQMSSS